jgi:hypothetical protein
MIGLRHTAALTLLGVGLILMQATCGGDSPSAPSPPPSGPVVQVASVVIAGAGSLTATATYSDGTTKNVTKEPGATWNSSDESIATVNGGLVTAEGYGTTSINFSYRDQFSYFDFRVLPTDNFILSGSVSEPVDQPLEEAVVKVSGGGGVAPRTTMTQYGSYSFVGVSGTLKVTASHSGYISEAKTVTMTRDQTLNFELTPTTAPATISGSYHLTITASGSCAGTLPAAMAKRTYTATVEQAGAGVTVTLSGAQFIPAREGKPGRPSGELSNLFSGRLSGKTLSVSLSHDDYYGMFFDVAEQLDTQYLGIGGEGSGTVSGSKISGTLSGSFEAFNSPPPGARVPFVNCTAEDHRFTFTK